MVGFTLMHVAPASFSSGSYSPICALFSAVMLVFGLFKKLRFGRNDGCSSRLPSRFFLVEPSLFNMGANGHECV